MGATCCTTKNTRWECGSLNVRVTTRRLLGPVVAIHVRDGRKRFTLGSTDPGLELYAPARVGEPPLGILPAVEPGPAAEPASDDARGSGAGVVVEAGTWMTVAGLGTLTAVVATGGGGSVGTVVGNVGTVTGTVTTGVETVTVGTVGTGTVSPSAWPASTPAPSSRIVAAAALISQ